MSIGDLDKAQYNEKLVERAIVPDELKGGNGSAGRSLFFEFNTGVTEVKPIYSIKEFHKRFVEIGDITEYKAAIELVGNWPAWEKIKKNFTGFASILDVWKEEIRTKMTSTALDKIQELIAVGSDTCALSAAKWIADQQFNKKTETPKTAYAKAKLRKEISDEASIPEDDLKRIEAMLNRADSSSNTKAPQ